MAFVSFLVAGGGPQALLLDGGGPWADAEWRAGARALESLLRDAGYQVRVVSPADLAQTSGASPQVLVAVPSLERLPLSAFKAIAAHAARGGSILASGGEPFREPLHRASTGEWLSVSELLLRAPQKVIVEPAVSQLRRATEPPAGVVSQEVVAGPTGRRDSLAVKITKPVRTDPLQLDFESSPFAAGQSTTILRVRGTPEEFLLVEWRVEGGTRWWARVPLTPEWKSHVLRPSDFTLPPTGGRAGNAPARFDPARARVLAFGLASEVNTPVTAPAEFAVGPIAVGSAPEIEDFTPPVLETISPWYKQYDAVRQGHKVRIPVARQRGLTMAKETEGRYDAVGDPLNPAASRFVTAAGASLYWMPWPEIGPRERPGLVEGLRESARRLVLLNGGPKEFVHLRDEPVRFGAQVLNASMAALKAEAWWTVRDGERLVAERRAAFDLGAGESREITAPDPQPLAPGMYGVELAVRSGAAVCDRIRSQVRVLDPRAPRPEQARLRVENGHFVAGRKQVFLNAVNYWPRNVSGLEAPRYWAHWLSPANYDPYVVEADLTMLEKLGFNVVSIQYNRLEQGRPLADFLERCRRHQIWAHLSIGSASNLRLAPERDTALLEAALLPGNESVFGYELAWEPHFGRSAERKRFDAAWRDWITEQYGSPAVAEQAWGMPGPKDEQGNLTNPPDEQIGADGPHRIMVAAYRRFLDDLVSRSYGRAVRHLRSMDPDALIAVRTGWGGTGQRGNNLGMGYDLSAGAAHLDATCPEGYGMPATFPEARGAGFVTAYGRFAGNGKPVFWLEFGASVGPREGNTRTLRNQARLADTTMRMIEDSGADGSAVWWFPGGWRFNERSDFGIFDPDGSPRESARLISDWGRKFNTALPVPGTGEPVVLRIDRDADARGLNGLWERFGREFVAAREAGRPVRLETAGTGTDTSNMPLVQAGNVPYQGTGPLKYANAEITGVRIAWDGGERSVENGSEVEVPANTEYRVTVSLLNTGEAAWAGCSLRTSAGDTPVTQRAGRFDRATAGPLRVPVDRGTVELTGRMAAGDKSFGEPLRLRLRPAGVAGAFR